jgi:hypothetical protein
MRARLRPRALPYPVAHHVHTARSGVAHGASRASLSLFHHGTEPIYGSAAHRLCSCYLLARLPLDVHPRRATCPCTPYGDAAPHRFCGARTHFSCASPPTVPLATVAVLNPSLRWNEVHPSSGTTSSRRAMTRMDERPSAQVRDSYSAPSRLCALCSPVVAGPGLCLQYGRIFFHIEHARACVGSV